MYRPTAMPWAILTPPRPGLAGGIYQRGFLTPEGSHIIAHSDAMGKSPQFLDAPYKMIHINSQESRGNGDRQKNSQIDP